MSRTINFPIVISEQSVESCIIFRNIFLFLGLGEYFNNFLAPKESNLIYVHKRMRYTIIIYNLLAYMLNVFECHDPEVLRKCMLKIVGNYVREPNCI